MCFSIFCTVVVLRRIISYQITKLFMEHNNTATTDDKDTKHKRESGHDKRDQQAPVPTSESKEEEVELRHK